MNIRGLVGALLPVFFVLALGYIAGKRLSFNADQAAGLSKVALSFALPASLFVGMPQIPRDLLLEQGQLVLVLMAKLGRITVQTAVLFALLRLLHVHSPFAREALVCCSFPLATIVVLLAAKYKAMEGESASALLLSTLSLVVTVPLIIAISK
jgi:malonate transporter